MSIEPLAVLIGTWEIVGRSVDADHDNIRGRVEIEPILDGNVLQLKGVIGVGDAEVESLELVWPDASGEGFDAHVYSGRGEPLDYRWQRTGNKLIHAGGGATYTGTISDDGATIAGSWRPDPGQPAQPGSAYDATMRRLS